MNVGSGLSQAIGTLAFAFSLFALPLTQATAQTPAKIEYWMGGGRLSGIREYVAVQFAWHQFFAVQIWIFTLFLIYTTAAELSALFGEGELTRISFTRSLSQMKLTPRQQIHTLVKLTRLTEPHTLTGLGDPHAAAHAEMIELISGLTMARANWSKLKQAQVLAAACRKRTVPDNQQVSSSRTLRFIACHHNP
jgi:hypothetical protein